MKFISQVALVRRAPSAALPALAFFLLGGKVKAISQAPLFWSRLSFSIFAQYCNVILSFPFFFPTGKGAKKLGKKRCEKTRVEDKLLQELIYLFNVEVCPLCVTHILSFRLLLFFSPFSICYLYAYIYNTITTYLHVNSPRIYRYILTSKTVGKISNLDL